MREHSQFVSIKRHIAKTVSYRIIGTITTSIIAYSVTGSFTIASMLGVGEIVLKPVVYFLHERVWYNYIKFGIKKKE